MFEGWRSIVTLAANQASAAVSAGILTTSQACTVAAKRRRIGNVWFDNASLRTAGRWSIMTGETLNATHPHTHTQSHIHTQSHSHSPHQPPTIPDSVSSSCCATVFLHVKANALLSGICRQDAKQLARLKHPRILSQIEVLCEDKVSLTFATKYVEGTVETLLPALGSDERVLGFFDLVDAVDFLHSSAKLVHNDLVLSNVFVNDRGGWLLSGLGLSSPVKPSDRVPLDEQLKNDYLALGTIAQKLFKAENPAFRSDDSAVTRGGLRDVLPILLRGCEDLTSDSADFGRRRREAFRALTANGTARTQVLATDGLLRILKQFEEKSSVVPEIYRSDGSCTALKEDDIVYLNGLFGYGPGSSSHTHVSLPPETRPPVNSSKGSSSEQSLGALFNDDRFGSTNATPSLMPTPPPAGSVLRLSVSSRVRNDHFLRCRLIPFFVYHMVCVSEAYRKYRRPPNMPIETEKGLIAGLLGSLAPVADPLLRIDIFRRNVEPLIRPLLLAIDISVQVVGALVHFIDLMLSCTEQKSMYLDFLKKCLLIRPLQNHVLVKLPVLASNPDIGREISHALLPNLLAPACLPAALAAVSELIDFIDKSSLIDQVLPALLTTARGTLSDGPPVPCSYQPSSLPGSTFASDLLTFLETLTNAFHLDARTALQHLSPIVAEVLVSSDVDAATFQRAQRLMQLLIKRVADVRCDPTSNSSPQTSSPQTSFPNLSPADFSVKTTCLSSRRAASSTPCYHLGDHERPKPIRPQQVPKPETKKDVLHGLL